MAFPRSDAAWAFPGSGSNRLVPCRLLHSDKIRRDKSTMLCARANCGSLVYRATLVSAGSGVKPASGATCERRASWAVISVRFTSSATGSVIASVCWISPTTVSTRTASGVEAYGTKDVDVADVPDPDPAPPVAGGAVGCCARCPRDPIFVITPGIRGTPKAINRYASQYIDGQKSAHRATMATP